EDQGGANTPMVAYAVPVWRGDEVVGVVTVDLSLAGFFGETSRFGEGLERLRAGQQGRNYAVVVFHTRTKWDTHTARQYRDGQPGTGVFVSHPRFAFPQRIQDLHEAPDRYRAIAERILAVDEKGELKEKEDKGFVTEAGKRIAFLFARVPTIEWTLVVVIE